MLSAHQSPDDNLSNESIVKIAKLLKGAQKSHQLSRDACDDNVDEEYLQELMSLEKGWNFVSFIHNNRLVFVALHVNEKQLNVVSKALHYRIIRNLGFAFSMKKNCKFLFLNPKVKYLLALFLVAAGYPQLKPIVDLFLT